MGNLYRTLRRMEEDGLVLSSWIKDNPGPQKRVYEVSEAGREALQFWAKGVEQRRNFLQKFLDLYEAQFGKEEQ